MEWFVAKLVVTGDVEYIEAEYFNPEKVKMNWLNWAMIININ